MIRTSGTNEKSVLRTIAPDVRWLSLRIRSAVTKLAEAVGVASMINATGISSPVRPITRPRA